MELYVCHCSPAALQLLTHSLFPCAPLEPSLAVDLKMLQFTNELFLRSPPNNTAWCDTLETYLGSRGYKLTTRVRLNLLVLFEFTLNMIVGLSSPPLWECLPMVFCHGQLSQPTCAEGGR
jgi:hypothetical protein